MGAAVPGIVRSRRSPNHGARIGSGRPDCIVLHYTGMRDAAAAVDRLCDPASQVSSHYVVTETGVVMELVPEHLRAWHAGRSSWRGETDLNSASVGIEIVNGGHDFGLPCFPAAQVEAVLALCRDIMRRHGIPPARILAHSDIAPGRKRDPGERFPWALLAEAGVGLWPTHIRPRANDVEADAASVQARLIRFGYALSPTALHDAQTATVLEAFQRRYRPERVDGIADAETIARLDAVLDLHGLACDEADRTA